MNPQQAPEAPAQTATAPRSIFDDLIENTEARRQAEQAKSDKLAAKAYSEDAQAYAIALGRDYGLDAAHALNMIHVINGKPCLSANARATFLKQAGYDWRPTKDGFTDERVRLRFFYKGQPMQDADGGHLELEYTIKDAERANFVQNSRGTNGKIGNYDKFPKNMLFARCISNFHRFFAAEVIGATVYDRGEVPLEEVIAVTEEDMASKSASKLDALAAELETVKANGVSHAS